MAKIKYYWTINPLECYPTSSQGPDYVLVAHWQLHAETGSYSAQIIGTQTMASPSTGSGSFIAFQDLTLDLVQGWIEQSMGEEKVNELKENLAKNIESQINPPVVTLQSPWLNTTGSL